MNHDSSADGRALIAAALNAPAPARTALRARVHTLLDTLGHPVGQRNGANRHGRNSDATDISDALEKALLAPEPQRIWLLMAVLSARLPEHAAVQENTRLARLDGPLSVAATVLTDTLLGQKSGPWCEVEVVTDQVVVDLHHTAQTAFATGIQRVARESAVRWNRDHDLVPVGWTKNYHALRRLTAAEIQRAMYGTTVRAKAEPDVVGEAVLVPWRCTYLVPELLAEPDRARAFQALVRHSASTVAMLGFDCVPLTTAETTADGMGGAFSMMLSAATYAHRIATISHGAAREYNGWAAMLAGRDLTGPEVRAISLPIQSQPASPAGVQRASWQFTLPGLPMMLVVGSHEPRKNHLAVLHAAERLWRDGLAFSLVFVGGNAWSSERFAARLRELQDQSRPVHSMSAIDDDVLWAAYRAARCTIFPSLNEGFGLPVAESLACGTPVITSNFGSMREIAGSGGSILINPREDEDLLLAMRSLLTDDELHARLSAEALALPTRSWDDYAAEAWDYLVEAKSYDQSELSSP